MSPVDWPRSAGATLACLTILDAGRLRACFRRGNGHARPGCSIWPSRPEPGSRFCTDCNPDVGVGIGANTAIFSIIYAALLRPLPYQKPGQLVRLYGTEAAPGNYPFTGPDFLDWKTQNHSFQDMTLISWAHSMNLSGRGEPDHVMGVPTESNFFSLLGARPLLGRTWAAAEDEPDHDHVLILGYGLWQSHFGGDPKILGSDVELNGEKYSVIGVMPAGFHFPSEAQLWIPQDMDSKSLGQRGSHSFRAFGRLRPGVSLQQAQSEMSVIASRLEQQYPDSNHKVGASLVELHEDMVGESRSSLLNDALGGCPRTSDRLCQYRQPVALAGSRS